MCHLPFCEAIFQRDLAFGPGSYSCVTRARLRIEQREKAAAETIPEEDEDEDKEEFEIDPVLEAALAPRMIDWNSPEKVAYRQLKKMAPRKMQRKVIILGAPSVGMSPSSRSAGLRVE
jgi:hypothetical protein